MSKKIIFAVLNWGLGHATRSSHIIRELQSLQCEVVLASDGMAKIYLEKEFPSLTSYELPHLNILYPSNHSFFNMCLTLPRLLKSIHAEHQSIKKIVQIEKPDAIVSDNRYGCYTDKTTNIVISHQLNLALPIAMRYPVNFFVRRLLNQFDECWIPDTPEQTLSGNLSNGNLSIPKRFIGPISHFANTVSPLESYKRELIVVLSGPEPQRQYLEQKILKQLVETSITTLIVRGVPDPQPVYVSFNSNITTISHLTSKDLMREIQCSKFILSRSGYSTIMDLVYLKRSALLIPTPGQPEQIYLARLMQIKGFHHCISQDRLDITSDLSNIPMAQPFISENDQNIQLRNILKKWIQD